LSLKSTQFDIESIKKANQSLIDTINESLEIADEGKLKRKEAEAQLEVAESELRKTLAAASVRESRPEAAQNQAQIESS